MIDREGLLHAGRRLAPEKAEFAVDPARIPSAILEAGGDLDLAAAIEFWRPDVLIGTTAIRGRFDEAAIRALARVSARPIVLALSNPITACEVEPRDVFTWTDGRAIVATGSPIEPVMVDGVERQVGQGNNAFVFPGLGLGAIVAEAREVTDGMLLVAARTLAAEVSGDRVRAGLLYPPIGDLPRVARSIACAVVREARDSGFGRQVRDELVEQAVDEAMWTPTYRRYRPPDGHGARSDAH
jgi:malate dehydrogenase (oxaloacetate-decarboxylating)